LTSIEGNMLGWASAGSPSTMSPTSLRAADRAIDTIGQRTVVRGGQIWAAIGVSSKPITDNSSGTAMPRSRAAKTTPAAISSLLAKIAVGRGDRSSRRLAAVVPVSNV
jgi:hypothetical protein